MASNVFENWQAKIDEMVREREEVASWARRILAGIERARLEFAFDPDADHDGEKPTGSALHAPDWFAITDRIDLWCWSFESFAAACRATRPEGWPEAVKLARAAWEDEAQARVRSAREAFELARETYENQPEGPDFDFDE